MGPLKEKLHTLYHYLDFPDLKPHNARRRKLLSIMLLAAAACAVVMVPILAVASPLGAAGQQNETTLMWVSIGATLLGTAGIYVLNRYASGELAGAFFIAFLIAVAALCDTPENVANGRGLLVFTIPILAASVLIRPWASFAAAVVSSIVITTIGLVILQKPIPNVPAMLVFFMLATVSWLSSRSLEEALEDQRTSNRLLREREKRFRHIYENTASGVTRISMDFRIESANEAYCKMLGYSEEELIGKRLEDLTHPEMVGKSLRREWTRTAGKLDHYRMEKRYVHKSGKPVYGILDANLVRDADGEPAYFFGSVVDITDRKRAEEELMLRDRAIESSINAISLADLDGNVTYVNPAAVQMWGFEDESEIVGQNAGVFWHSRRRARKAYQRTLREESWEGEMTACRKDGSSFPAQVSMSVVKNEYGEATHILGVFLDVTKRKAALNELKEANEQLKETLEELHETQQQLVDQERQRALNQMASGIAHDFNNALSTIRGFTDLLLNNEDKAADRRVRRRYLRHIDTAARHAAETVGRMRKFYRPDDTKEFISVDLNRLVEEAVSMTRPRWKPEAQAKGRDIEVVKNLGRISAVRGDESELHEMLTNLIFNAVDAIESEGTVTVSTQALDGQVVLEVRDTGCGMDEETRQRCLDPFYTTKVESGTGLGLSVTRGIVGRHKGDIEIESQPGEGTAVRISLPASHEADQPDPPDSKDTPHRELNVLVVEDDEVQRELLLEILHSDGHTVELAANGREGIEKFNAGQYELVITDRAMPELNGDEVARLVKREASHKPVIMLTGFGDMMEAADEFPEGVDVVISKPVNLEKLKDAISRALTEPRHA